VRLVGETLLDLLVDEPDEVFVLALVIKLFFAVPLLQSRDLLMRQSRTNMKNIAMDKGSTSFWATGNKKKV
jgi:hypothetical protein